VEPSRCSFTPVDGRPAKGDTVDSTSYLLAGQATELDRLRLQSLVWEPSGRRLLEAIGEGAGARALDVGCGVLGWLGLLSDWVGDEGTVVGTDIDDAMLRAAETFVTDRGIGNVVLVKDDLFRSALEPASFDLVHARFVLTPLGRGPEHLAAYLGLARPGGTVVLEDPDWGSWHFNPPAPALEQLIALTHAAFQRWGDADAGRKHLELFHSHGIEADVRAEVLALPPEHPYLRLPLQMATGLAPRLRELVDPAELEGLHQQGATELGQPGRWGTTFTLLQTWGKTSR
jgi:SAM-dependent methyltransferase